jgi:hypothetical protein
VLALAAGLMTLEELGSKLSKLEETRRMAEAELAALEAREERVNSKPNATASWPPTRRYCQRR